MFKVFIGWKYIMNLKNHFGKKHQYIWSDNWFLENDRAWFIAGSMNILFGFEQRTQKATLIDKIPPDVVGSLRLHSRCLKIREVIYCLPDNGKDIWCYHLDECKWTNILIDGSAGLRIGCNNAWVIQDTLYVVSSGLKRIIEVNTITEKVEAFYILSLDQEEHITGSVLIDDHIYVVGAKTSVIYKFNTYNKQIKSYKLPLNNDQIQTICFDGRKFWLSGRKKKIYIWEEGKKDVVILSEFPKNLKMWNFSGKFDKLINSINDDFNDVPLFISSIAIGDYVWFIPFQTNNIIYINKNNFEMNVFSIEEEEHTEENVKKQFLQHKYLLEYVKDKRYLGIFSLKNKWLFEIDCIELKYEVFDYSIDNSEEIKSYYIVEGLMKKNSTIDEQRELNVEDWIKAFISKYKKKLVVGCDYKDISIGNSIYNEIL